MTNELQVLNAATKGGAGALYGGRNPKDRILVNGVDGTVGKVDKRTGEVFYVNRRGQYVANSMLTKDEWIEMEDTVIQPALYPLKLVNLLRSRGLVKRLGGIGTLITTWYMTGEVTPAGVNMTGMGNAENDLPDVGQAGAPVPVIFKPFQLDARQLEASRRSGDGLDLTALYATTRVVNEKLEDLIVNGANVKLNGFSLYGLRNHPYRITSTAAGDWGTISNILPTVNAMVAAAQVNKFYGPYALFISQDQWLEANNLYYGSDSNITPISRIRENMLINYIDWLPAEILPAGELLLVQLTPDVIDLAEAMGVQVREWSSGDGWQTSFKVLTVAAPRIKARGDNKTGIVHFTGA